jgi:hypothetical protein
MIFIDESQDNKTVTYPTTVTVKGNSTTTVTPPTFSLYVGDVLLGTGDPAEYDIEMSSATHKINYSTPGNANWTSAENVSLYLIVNKGTPTIWSFEFNDTYIHINESIELRVNATSRAGANVTVEIQTSDTTLNFTTSFDYSTNNYTLTLTKTQLGDLSDNATIVNLTKVFTNGQNYTMTTNTTSESFDYALTNLSVSDDAEVVTPGTIVNIYADYETKEDDDITLNCTVNVRNKDYLMTYDPTDSRHEAAIDTTGFPDEQHTYTVTCVNSSYQSQSGSGDFATQTGVTGGGTLGGGGGGGVVIVEATTTTTPEPTLPLEEEPIVAKASFTIILIGTIYIFWKSTQKKKKKKEMWEL